MVRVLKIYNGANDIEGIHGRRVLKSRFQNEWLEPHPSNKTGKIYKSGELWLSHPQRKGFAA